MFEEEFGGFGFGFEGESEDGKFYCDSIHEFDMLTKMLPIDEVGLSFTGEIKIDDMTSVLTDKKIKFKDPEEAKKTYIKVMEMRELTEIERSKVSKVKLVLKKTLDVLFKGKKWLAYYCGLCVLMTTGHIIAENYLSALIWSGAFILNSSPIKYAKELNKLFGSKKQKEKLKEELIEANIYGYVNSVEEDEGVQFYFVPKAPNM